MPSCECTWKNCHHKGQPQDAADHGSVQTSPAYCMPCLFICCGERDDEELMNDIVNTQQIGANERFDAHGVDGYEL